MKPIILEVRKMFERLTRWENNDKDVADLIEEKSDFDGLTEAVNRLAAYEDSGLSPEEVQELPKQMGGWWLPCKVGDVVWKIKAVFSYFSKPMEDRVERIIISSNEILVCCTSGTKFSVNSIGKTVFLSREAAEKALGGGEMNKTNGRIPGIRYGCIRM